MLLRARSTDRCPKDRRGGEREREQVLEHQERRLAPGQTPLRQQIRSSKCSKCAVEAQTENPAADPLGRSNRVQRKGRIRGEADSDLLHLGRKIKSRHQLDSLLGSFLNFKFMCVYVCSYSFHSRIFMSRCHCHSSDVFVTII